jgi:hypothetical protein
MNLMTNREFKLSTTKTLLLEEKMNVFQEKMQNLKDKELENIHERAELQAEKERLFLKEKKLKEQFKDLQSFKKMLTELKEKEVGDSSMGLK